MSTKNIIVGITALAIAGCAAYFSVIGISKLFGGSPVATMIMGGVLEFGKLVCASVAYQFWVNGGRSRFISLIFAVMTLIMMFVTSIGIFGFLSNSYQQVSNQLKVSESQIAVLDQRKDRFQRQTKQYQQERSLLLQDKESLREDMSRANAKYAERGWATDRQQVERIQDQIESVNESLSNINNALRVKTDSITSIESQILKISTGEASQVKTKLGPIMQTADLFGVDRNKSALIFIGIIMSVFDPMAVMLVVAFNIMNATKRNNVENAPQEDKKDFEGDDKDNSRKTVKTDTADSDEPLDDEVVYQRDNGSFYIKSEDFISSDAGQTLIDRLMESEETVMEENSNEDENEITEQDIQQAKEKLRNPKYLIGDNGSISVKSREDSDLST